MKKNLFILLFVIGFTSCKKSQEDSNEKKLLEDNKELQAMHDADQSDRRPENGKIDWTVVLPKDSIRLTRAYQLVDSNKVHTAKDYYNAAIIFQHGYDSIASGSAVKMMKKAVKMDSTINKWLLAAAIDRDLQRRGKPQIFGIQFTKNRNNLWVLYDIDTTKVTDAERKKYGVPSLASLRAEAAKMNQ